MEDPRENDNPDHDLSFTEAELRGWLRGDGQPDSVPDRGELVVAVKEREEERAALWRKTVEHELPVWFSDETILEIERAGLKLRYVPRIEVTDEQRNRAQPVVRELFDNDLAEPGWHVMPQRPVGGPDFDLLLFDFYQAHPELAEEIIRLKAHDTSRRLVADYYYVGAIIQNVVPTLAEDTVRAPTAVEQYYLASTEPVDDGGSQTYLCVNHEGIIPMYGMTLCDQRITSFTRLGMADDYTGVLTPLRRVA